MKSDTIHTQVNEIHEFFIVGGTVLLALFLTLLPMPHWIISFRPAWIMLALVFWALYLPGKTSMTLAWVLGIVLDVLNGSLLGEHAFALTLMVYFVARFSSQLRMFTLFQQGVGVFLIVLSYLFILYCIQGFLGDLPEGLLYWSPALTSMLLWPWVFIIMRDWYRRFET